jgi:hypothetical protein
LCFSWGGGRLAGMGAWEAQDVGFPFGVARECLLVPEGDAWWAPMSDEEAEAWATGEWNRRRRWASVG